MYHQDTECCYICPSCLDALSVGNLYCEIFTAALLLATALFSDCLKKSSAQDVSSTLNRWNRVSLHFRNYTTWLAHMNIMETNMFSKHKKVIMVRERLLRLVALKQNYEQCLYFAQAIIKLSKCLLWKKWPNQRLGRFSNISVSLVPNFKVGVVKCELLRVYVS